MVLPDLPCLLLRHPLFWFLPHPDSMLADSLQFCHTRLPFVHMVLFEVVSHSFTGTVCFGHCFRFKTASFYMAFAGQELLYRPC